MDREPPGRFEESVSTALGLSILFIYLSHRRGGSFKPLELFDVAYFGTLAVIGLLASDNLITWLEKWSGEMSSLALVAFAFGSLLVRNPFTLPYAKETTPEEYWDSPLFPRVNRIITLVWALSFTVSAAAGLYGDVVLDQPDNFWTGWIIQIGAMLFAFSFTEWYPDVANARAPRAPAARGRASAHQTVRLPSAVRDDRRDRDARHRQRALDLPPSCSPS